MAKIIQHYDRLGQEIKVGSIVVAPNDRSSISISRVVKLNPIMINCVSIGNKYNYTFGKYPNEVVDISKMEETIMYLLGQNL